jgi:FkbM family methyltransferase
LVFQKGEKRTSTRLLGKRIVLNSPFWYLHGLKEIFLDRTYKFRAKNNAPRIIDCGGNIGLSSIFFKRRYPQCRLTVFEPDPEICAMLSENLRCFGFDDINVENKAVWTENGSVNFIASGGVSGRIGEESEDSLLMQATRLRDLLEEPVDFLKIDIEGAEHEVIRDCAPLPGNVDNIFIEYHSSEAEEQQLDSILRFLKEAGFRYYLKEAWVNQPHPFTNDRNNLFDLQLNIFGYRSKPR